MPRTKPRNFERRISLDRQVIAVASVNTEVGDWAAYIGSVSGGNHDTEWRNVLARGSKLPKDIAETMFAELAAEYDWRY